MRSLVQEYSDTYLLPAAVLSETFPVTIASKDIRPRLEGYEDALRGAALSAQLADRGTVVYQIRVAAATDTAALAILGGIQATFRVEHQLLLGTDLQFNPATGNTTTLYPYFSSDVSGRLFLFRGRLAFDLQDIGVTKSSLTLTNYGATDASVLITVQVFADVRIPDWEDERLGIKKA
jgi:hypothetical protein